MQRSVITTEMANTLGGSGAARYSTWINMAISRIAAARIWSFLLARQVITLVAGQEGYALALGTPSLQDFGGILDVTLALSGGTSSGVPLAAVESPQLYDRLTKHNVVAGTPMLYTVTASIATVVASGSVRAGGQLELRVSPRPTAVAGQGVSLDVLYKRTTESIKPSNDADILIGPEEFGFAVMQYAMAIGFASMGNLPNAQFWRTLAVESLQSLVTQDEVVLPIRDASRLTMAAPPNITGPSAGQISASDLPLPVARQGAA